ncbi:MAG: glycosyltransferase family 10 [Gammaproteobacteria bacterium]|nr:glycosyltransferase family 10 [Gammaproteobacteria bacterium]
MPAPITVKFLTKDSLRAPGDAAWWRRQLPGAAPTWGRCRFEFDAGCTSYDWLVVYDDLPVVPPGNRHRHVEPLPCPRENTLFITAEPSSIKTYGSAFLDQFGVVLTSHEPWALRHRDAIRSQPGLRWHYAIRMDDRQPTADLDTLRAAGPPAKSRTIASVTSSKRMRLTHHRRRYAFVTALRDALPEFDLYGYGFRRIDDKRDALDPYRYHVAIENHLAPRHWTEKLADAFLGYTLPFYHGAPDAADDFPAESFIPIDVSQPERAIRTIREAITADAYARRLEAVTEARRRVLETHNLFALLAREIEAREARDRPRTPGGTVRARHLVRVAGPGRAVRYAAEATYVRARHLLRGRG